MDNAFCVVSMSCEGHPGIFQGLISLSTSSACPRERDLSMAYNLEDCGMSVRPLEYLEYLDCVDFISIQKAHILGRPPNLRQAWI